VSLLKRTEEMLIMKKLLTQAASYKSCASAAKLLGGGPILETGFQNHGLLRVTATSDHHRTLDGVLARQPPRACLF